MRSLIVVPTYNEIENIQNLVQAALAATPESVHLLVVDDNSPDGTGALVKTLKAENPRLHLLEREGKQGLGSAYIAGFKFGLSQGFDVIIEMDADFSHHPRYLQPMLENVQKYDFAIGSRYVSGGGTVNWGLIRKIISRGGSLYSRMILNTPIKDFTGGFNGWNRKVLEAIQLDTIKSDGYSFQIELKYRAHLKGFSHIEFPIVFEDRKEGHSKMSQKIVIEALQRVWQFRLSKSELLSGGVQQVSERRPSEG